MFVTGGTYSNGIATFTNNDGGTFGVNGFFTAADDVYVSGMTFDQGNFDLTITRNDGQSFTESLAILASDMTVTGGTYNPVSGVASFVTNSGNTFDVSGFLTGYTDTSVVSGVYDNNTGVATFTNSTGGTFDVSGFLTGSTGDIFVTGGTYSAGTLTLNDNNGGTFEVSGFTSGITVSSESYEFIKQSGAYYGLADYDTFQLGNASSNFSSNELLLTPYFAKDDIDIASLCLITQSANPTGALGKISVYSSDPVTQRPSTLITQTAELNIETSGTKEGVLPATLSLVKGTLYYFGVSINVNANLCNYPYTNNGLKPILLGTAGFQNTPYVGYYYMLMGGESSSSLPSVLNNSNIITTWGSDLAVVKYKAL